MSASSTSRSDPRCPARMLRGRSHSPGNPRHRYPRWILSQIVVAAQCVAPPGVPERRDAVCGPTRISDTTCSGPTAPRTSVRHSSQGDKGQKSQIGPDLVGLDRACQGPRGRWAHGWSLNPSVRFCGHCCNPTSYTPGDCQHPPPRAAMRSPAASTKPVGPRSRACSPPASLGHPTLGAPTTRGRGRAAPIPPQLHRPAATGQASGPSLRARTTVSSAARSFPATGRAARSVRSSLAEQSIAPRSAITSRSL